MLARSDFTEPKQLLIDSNQTNIVCWPLNKIQGDFQFLVLVSATWLPHSTYIRFYLAKTITHNSTGSDDIDGIDSD